MAQRLAFISLACIFIIWAATESNAAVFFYHRPKPESVSIIEVIFFPIYFIFLPSNQDNRSNQDVQKIYEAAKNWVFDLVRDQGFFKPSTAEIKGQWKNPESAPNYLFRQNRK